MPGQINFNQLKQLQVILETQSLTVASEQLFLTQPALSAALKQLRDFFDDPLLVKGQGASFELTIKAKRLKTQLSENFLKLEEVVHQFNRPFDPKVHEGVFQIGVPDYLSFSIIPKLRQRLRAEAPGVTLRHFDVQNETLMDATSLNRFDCIIALDKQKKARLKDFDYEKVLEEDLVCLSSIDEVNRKRALNLSDIKKYPHILFSYRVNYTNTHIDSCMQHYGVERRFDTQTSNAQMVGYLLSIEPALAVTMRRHAEVMKEAYPIQYFELPFQSFVFDIYMLTRKVHQSDPAIQWFKSLVSQVISEVWL